MGKCYLSSCFKQSLKSSSITLIFWEGNTRTLPGRKTHVAGEIMFEFPDKMVCQANSFFLGRPVTALSIQDQLVPGQTYFVLPIERFAFKTLTTSFLSSFNSNPKCPAINFSGGESPPFEYLKDEDGRALIKILPEFITRIINGDKKNSHNDNNNENKEDMNDILCSTPELKKHYAQLVGFKVQVWSPKLETISEHKIRFSPCRIIGLKWKLKKKIR